MPDLSRACQARVVSRSRSLQIDGLVGTNGGFFTTGTGGHAFWRNPGVALLGAHGDVAYDARLGGLKVAQTAAEAELYLGRFTARGLFGYQSAMSPPASSPRRNSPSI